LTVQIFDQKKFKKKDQGFLGVINIPVAAALDLDLGGDGEVVAPDDSATVTLIRHVLQTPSLAT
jgi:hypothetical protein